MKNFPGDVVKAEEMTKGNINILQLKQQHLCQRNKVDSTIQLKKFKQHRVQRQNLTRNNLAAQCVIIQQIV
jgi:hypothetical protein